jgi:hypothetical protein
MNREERTEAGTLAGNVGPIVLLLMAGTLQGCPLILLGGGATGGGAGVAYAKGELEQVHAAPYDRVWDATLRALRTLNIAVSETQKRQISAKAVGARADGTAVVVSVLPVTKTAPRCESVSETSAIAPPLSGSRVR